MFACLLDELAVRIVWTAFVVVVIRIAAEVALAHFRAARYRARRAGPASGTNPVLDHPSSPGAGGETGDPGRARAYPRPTFSFTVAARPVDWRREGWL